MCVGACVCAFKPFSWVLKELRAVLLGPDSSGAVVLLSVARRRHERWVSAPAATSGTFGCFLGPWRQNLKVDYWLSSGGRLSCSKLNSQRRVPSRSHPHERLRSPPLTGRGCSLSGSPEASRTAGRRLAGRGFRAALGGRPRTPPVKKGSLVSGVSGNVSRLCNLLDEWAYDGAQLSC